MHQWNVQKWYIIKHLFQSISMKFDRSLPGDILYRGEKVQHRDVFGQADHIVDRIVQTDRCFEWCLLNDVWQGTSVPLFRLGWMIVRRMRKLHILPATLLHGNCLRPALGFPVHRAAPVDCVRKRSITYVAIAFVHQQRTATLRYAKVSQRCTAHKLFWKEREQPKKKTG